MAKKSIAIAAILSATLVMPALAEQGAGNGTLPFVVAPVQIFGCSLIPPSGSIDDVRSPFGPHGMWIAFMNASDRVMDAVTFDVEQAGNHRTVIDKGTFESGLAFNYFSDDVADLARREGPTTCKVTGVHFADGGSWRP
jgi:hypothetical protein